MKRTLAVATVILAWAGCRPQPPAPEPSRFSPQQLQARFSWDLGPDTVNVAAYPEAQRSNYELFATVCSQCHTLARPVNSPYKTRGEWDRLIRRMHERTLVYGWWTEFAKADAGRVLDFLEYDSKVRKIDGAEAFERVGRDLEALFAEVKSERARLQMERDRANAKTPAPYVGDKP